MFPPLPEVKGTVPDYNFRFRVTHDMLVQSIEGSRRNMTPRIIDDITLGPNGDLQGSLQDVIK